jgi:5'-3' exonuclease
MRIHLVDGTYELFRSFFGAPPKKAPDGREVGATLGLLNSLLALLSKSGATHVACAFDHVIESFRNDLFPGYKTGSGIAAELLAQFPLAEEAVAALGVVVSRRRRRASSAKPTLSRSSSAPRTKIWPS